VLLHALFASFVHQKGPGATPEGRERFHSVARSYIEAKGRHVTIVSEWLEVMR
jgi:hypothetical protein